MLTVAFKGSSTATKNKRWLLQVSGYEQCIDMGQLRCELRSSIAVSRLQYIVTTSCSGYLSIMFKRLSRTKSRGRILKTLSFIVVSKRTYISKKHEFLISSLIELVCVVLPRVNGYSTSRVVFRRCLKIRDDLFF